MFFYEPKPFPEIHFSSLWVVICKRCTGKKCFNFYTKILLFLKILYAAFGIEKWAFHFSFYKYYSLLNFKYSLWHHHREWLFLRDIRILKTRFFPFWEIKIFSFSRLFLNIVLFVNFFISIFVWSVFICLCRWFFFTKKIRYDYKFKQIWTSGKNEYL